ncbi:hypothetical protein H2203_009283 [Taxawa tesnikishii (nom. ined.)]|nr:hypothetical protein H2203_009283 [Dothideales sp. JES 119]
MTANDLDTKEDLNTKQDLNTKHPSAHADITPSVQRKHPLHHGLLHSTGRTRPKTLFDPEAAATSAIRIDKQLPPHPSYTISTFTQIRALESSIIRPLATTDTTRESVQDVIQQLSVLISQHPTLASAYVNRAQARRLLVSPSELFATKDLVDQVLHDLGRAIDFASPSSPTEAVSPYQADVLAASHTHRAVILLKLAELLRHDDDDGTAARGVNASLGDLGADAVEELASRDFALGASSAIRWRCR